MHGLFGPASTKEGSNKPAENRDRRLKSRAVLFSESQKNIYWASIDVKFYILSNCIFKNVLSLFSPRYRGSKSAVIFNSDDKHRAHNIR